VFNNSFLRKFSQISLFVKKLFLLILSPRYFYRIILEATKDLPKISIKTSKHGTFCGLENDILFRMALEFGSNEDHFKKIVNSLVMPNSNVLDLGANIGTHSIILSKAIGTGNCYSIEPQSLIYTILQNNLMLNNCENVHTFRFAISDLDNEVLSMEPFSYSNLNINNGARRVETSGGNSGDWVLSKKIDSFNFPKISFIKLDIQGSEIKALKGAKSLILKDRPVLFVEIEEVHLKKFSGSSKELIETLLSYDYILFRILNEYPCDHLCIPREQIELFESTIATNLHINLLKIDGKKVDLSFSSNDSMTYNSIKVFN
jgi:FkbM family methyltransferase